MMDTATAAGEEGGAGAGWMAGIADGVVFVLEHSTVAQVGWGEGEGKGT